MDKESVKHLIKSNAPWKHVIELGKGLYTIDKDEWPNNRTMIMIQNHVLSTIMPVLGTFRINDIQNTTILDVGCMDGWLSMILARKGYKKVTGIEPDKAEFDRAKIIKDICGLSNLELLWCDLSDFPDEKTFDVTINIGVLNHLCTPVEFIKRIYKLTGQLAIFSFYAFCPDEQDHTLEAFDVNFKGDYQGSMKCHFERGGAGHNPKKYELVFQYSKKAVVMMLQYAGFDHIVEVSERVSTPDFYRDKRVTLVAHKNNDSCYCFKELEIADGLTSGNHITLHDDLTMLTYPEKHEAPYVGTVFELKKHYSRYLETIKGKEILIWGISGFYETVKDIFKNVKIVAFVDNDKSENDLCGIPVISPDRLKHMKPMPIFICSAYKEVIIKQLRQEFSHFTEIP